VLVVTPGVGGADGIAEVTRQWVEALTAKAADGAGPAPVEVWSLTDTARPASLPASVTFRTGAGNRWRVVSLALKAADVGGTTLVIVMHVHLLRALWPLIWRGGRVITVMHGIEVWTRLRWLDRLALRHCCRAIAVSAHTVDRFRRENPELAGVPISICHSRAPMPVAPRQDAGGAPCALIVGRMSAAERYKGHDILIDIWPRVLAAVPDATLVVAGDGDDRRRLQAKADAAGLGARVIFAGRVPAEQLAALYLDATCFVMPSTGEGFGLVYLEAMRAGTPCIAGPGAAAEIVTDGVDGLIVDPRDPDAMTTAIVRLFTDVALRDRLGAAATARVEGAFTAEHFAARLSDILSHPC
jgi:glycosyltransferase involved in cell wall biosynthesis